MARTVLYEVISIKPNNMDLHSLRSTIQQNTIIALKIDIESKYPVLVCGVVYTAGSQEFSFSVCHDFINNESFFELLSNNSSLEILNITGVDLNEFAIHQIAKLINNNVLKTLFVDNCGVGNYFSILIESIASSSSIKDVVMTLNNINPELILEFCKAVALHSTLTNIDFGGNINKFYINPAIKCLLMRGIEQLQNNFYNLTLAEQKAATETLEYHRMQLLAWSLDEKIAQCFQENFVIRSIVLMAFPRQPMCDEIMNRNRHEMEQSRFKKVKPAQ